MILQQYWLGFANIALSTGGPVTKNQAAATTAYLSRVQPVLKLEHQNINTEVD